MLVCFCCAFRLVWGAYVLYLLCFTGRRERLRLRQPPSLSRDLSLHAERVERHDPRRVRVRQRRRPVRKVLGFVRRGEVLSPRKRARSVQEQRAPSRIIIVIITGECVRPSFERTVFVGVNSLITLTRYFFSWCDLITLTYLLINSLIN